MENLVEKHLGENTIFKLSTILMLKENTGQGETQSMLRLFSILILFLNKAIKERKISKTVILT